MGSTCWRRGKSGLFLALALAVGCHTTERRAEPRERDAAAEQPDAAAAEGGDEPLPEPDAGARDAATSDAAPPGDEDSGSEADAAIETDAAVQTDAQVPEREFVALPSGALGPCVFEPVPSAPAMPNANCEDGVFKGNVRINKPADIDKLRGCVRVRGNVDVEPGPLTDLSGLEALRVIEGNLTIRGTDCLCECGCTQPPVFQSARGLDNLRCVGGALSVDNKKVYASGNVSFKKLGSFGSLVEVGGAMTIDVDWIEDRNAFQSLQRVWGTMSSSTPNRLILPHLQAVFGDAKLGSEQPKLEYSCDGARPGPCYSGVIGCSYTASTDAQLQQVADCAIAMGDLTIGPDIHDLTPLRELKDVRRTLTFTGAISHAGQPLTDFGVLPKLARTSKLALHKLPAITSLASLQHLPALQGLVLNDLDALVTLAPLQLAESADIDVSGNALLTNLDGLATTNRLNTITLDDNTQLSQLNALGELQFTKRIVLRKLPALSSLSGFAKLWATDELVLDDCDALGNLDGPSKLTTVFRLWVTGNASLQTLWLTGMRSIESVEISDNPSLTNLTGLQGTRKLTLARLPVLADFSGTVLMYLDLRVEACDALQDLSGLENLNSVTVSIVLKNNANLSSLDGIDALRELDGISLIDNPKLAEVDALADLTRLGAVHIQHNPMLTSLDGLRGVDGFVGQWGTPGEIRIIDNDALTNLNGLDGRTQLPGLLHIEGNDGLVNLQGLEDLQYVQSGELIIRDNDSLTSLAGLSGLHKPSYGLYIEGNAALATLHDLTSIEPIFFLSVHDNPMLPQCEVKWLAMQVQVPEPEGTNGPTGPCP